ncbi:CPBP family intramembrane glutamic endopeptidase [Granulicella sibirica]|uniref:CPBP family intramembrane glutamic endopeptidase n=1 Tax=Granulicella sibirica TaxID=2479048 RepID=UPI0010088429|nr:CPBP family intramembrane glutamic endopeptidase [Granulicella sibirica]
MRVTNEGLSGWRDPRAWCAILLLAVSTYLEAPISNSVFRPIVHAFGIHHPPADTLGQGSYGTQMLIRLLWDLLLWAGVCMLLGRRLTGFPFRDRKWFLHLLLGLATGLSVMLATMLGIWGLGSASVASSGQSFASALGNGSCWLVLDFIGALGEEILGRAVILTTAERFLGWRGAILVSGLMFSGLHLHNPGASRVWLLRLFLQGALLAYAVFRTQSLWWSVGYHTGWNWISAPLFGAAGSGYLDEGHVFDFLPHGTTLITGGSVGPEGSLLAFLAVFVALALLTALTQPHSCQRKLGETH